MIAALLAVAAAIGTGIASALIPIVNAEAAMIAAAIASPPALTVLIAIGIAVGQTIGKVAMYEGARQGIDRHRLKHVPKPRVEMGRWRRRMAELNDWMIAMMKGRWSSNGILFASASVGIPPLFATTIVAGAAKTRRLDFIVCCLTGRVARFLVMAAPFIARK